MLCPTLGKVRIAQMLARAGLHLSASTVGRMLKRDLSRDDIAEEMPVASDRVVRARGPNHTWHVDLTTIPTSAGFWVSWFPHARVQSWPFSWWVAIALDHASRQVVGFAVFKRRPTSAQVCAFLGRAIKRAGSKPKYIIADKGKEFFCKRFKSWCRNCHIRPRFGAVGEHGSIAVIERLIRSMKSECTRQVLVPFRLDRMRDELGCYASSATNGVLLSFHGGLYAAGRSAFRPLHRIAQQRARGVRERSGSLSRWTSIPCRARPGRWCTR